MHFDLLIKNGRVIDPAQNRDGVADVAITRNRIAVVDATIPAESAFRIIDASGQIVTPGLIDLHTHVYRGATYWGVNADVVGPRSGVTTWLDVGSSGAFNFLGFREFVIKPASVRIYALLNISSIGLTGQNFELANLAYCDLRAFNKVTALNRDLILGVKVRMGTPTIGQNGLEPLRRARQAAEENGLPMMVHIATAPPAIEDVLALMRPNDILTHCYTGQSMKLIDDQHALRDAAKRAWDAGVIMDIGHGSGSFSFATAESLLGIGYKPDVISTDIHQESINGPMFDLPTVLSKFLAMGLPLAEVIARATSRPGEVLGMHNEIGTLKPGALADVALFRLDEGRFPFYDIHGQVREGKHLLRNTLTLVGGQALPVRLPDAPAPWIELTEFQHELVAKGHTPAAFLSAPSLHIHK
jgi:dihydroorotase